MCETHDNKDIVTSSEKDGGFDVFSIDIKNTIPNSFENIDEENMPKELYGAEIIKFGSLGKKYGGGGLGIEFKTKNGVIHRILFEFSEEGMWIEKQSC